MNDAQMLILCLCFLSCLGLGWLFGYAATTDKYLDYDFFYLAVPCLAAFLFVIKAAHSLIMLIINNWN